MEIKVFRGEALARERRNMPAATYNLARLLQARSPRGVAFVPIRSMQVLAVLDAEEFVFLDGQTRCWAIVSWTHFATHDRASLDDPVAFDCIRFEADAAETMQRLPREFHLALQALAAKQHVDGPARVLHLPVSRSAGS